jgi:hypothetical protein
MHALTFVQVIAVFFFIVAIDFAVRPDDLKGMLRVAIKGSMPHIIGIVRICVGGSRRMFIGVVGIVVLVAGILSLVVKLDTQKKVATKIINSSEMTRRIMGIAAAIIATLIVLDAWNCLW